MNKFLVMLVTFVLYAATIANTQVLDSINSARSLGGVLPEIIEKSVYVITGDVFVSPGSTVTVQAGTVFLFREFTGIHIQGALYVNGTVEEPVVFSSVNDTIYVRKTAVNAAPFDWNGIDIYEGALGTTFNNSKIQYTVYGIRSQTEYLKLESVTFANNGKSDFTIKNERKDVTVPFSYSFEYKPAKPETSRIVVDTQNYQAEEPVKLEKPTMGTEPPVLKKNGNKGLRVFFRVTGIALTLGGGALGAYFGNEYLDAQKRLDDLSYLDDVEKRTYTSKDWENAKDNRDQCLMKATISGSVAVLGLTSFFISFAF
jgi:hypothetical protein